MSRLIRTTLRLSAVALVLTSCAGVPPPQQESYIVQANDAIAAAAAVQSIGGEVTHELAIIRAVGADLSPTQAERLRAMDGLRIHGNHRLSLASGGVTGAGELLFDNGKVDWTLSNAGTVEATISRIEIAWPALNKNLKKIRLAGRDIFDQDIPPSSATIDSGWKNAVTDRRLGPGETAVLRIEFESNAVTNPAEYAITVFFAEGQSVEFVATVLPPKCPPVTVQSLHLGGHDIKWKIENTCP